MHYITNTRIANLSYLDPIRAMEFKKRGKPTQKQFEFEAFSQDKIYEDIWNIWIQEYTDMYVNENWIISLVSEHNHAVQWDQNWIINCGED